MIQADATVLRLLVAAAVLVVTGVSSVPVQSESPPAQARSVWDGVYTDTQAGRGRALYEQTCVSCHRDDLRGDSTAPSLVGESFMFLWGDMKVGELLAKVQKSMPPERPGSLPVQSYVDIIAYILQKNELPAGASELGVGDSAPQILITPKRP